MNPDRPLPFQGAADSIPRILAGLKPGFLGNFLYHCLPIRRSVIRQNIRMALGRLLTQEQQVKLAKSFYRHLGLLAVEILWVDWQSPEALRKRVEVRGLQYLLDAGKLGKGALILSGHFGNWELAPIGAILGFTEYKGRLHILRRQIVNKTVEKILFRRFYEVGLGIIPKKRSLDRVLDALERNEAVGFIMDQYARPGKEGIEVDFFGRPAGTFKSLAMVARSSGAPVIPAASWREEKKHVFEFYSPVPWVERADPDEEIRANTLRYNGVLEELVLRHPDQWWWMHRRWKRKGISTPPS